MLEYPNRFDSEEVRIRSHPNLAKPPTADLRDWRAGLTRRQQRAIESVWRASWTSSGTRRRSDRKGPCCTPGVSGSSTRCGWRQRGPAEGPAAAWRWRRRLGESALVGRWATGSPRD